MTPPGGWEWVIILFIVLLLFGARKLPDLAGSMGRSIREFRKAAHDADDDEASTDEDTPTSERDAES
jgi:sec-independent protein translocase protein TatA